MSEYDDLMRRGNVHYINREYDRAIEDYTKAIELNPNFALAYINRGDTCSKKGEYDRAIEDYTKAIELNPDNEWAYINRRDAYSKKGEYDKAIEDYTKAIELNPDNEWVYVYRRDAYSNKGENDKVVAYINRGDAYSNEGENDKVINDYTKVIEIAPNNALAHINRGDAYRFKGEYDRAIDDYTKAIEIDPNNEWAHINRGDANRFKGEYDRAIDDYTKAIDINPYNSSAYDNRGFVYSEKGEYDFAIDDYIRAIKIDPNNSNAYKNRGFVYDARGDHNLAKEDFIKSITLLWEKDILALNNSSRFFDKLIAKFKKKEFTSSNEYRNLITSVYILWNSLRYKNNKNNTKVYQYTSKAVLKSMRETRRLRLSPACYMNDPEEGIVFYNYLIQMLETNNPEIAIIIEKIKEQVNNNSIAFIRSLTVAEDSLIMWDSSYAENGEGVSVGISPKKLNGGDGIDILKEKMTIELNIKGAKTTFPIKKSSESLNISKTGLYEILYLDNKKAKGKLEDIKESLLKIPQEDWKKTDEEGNNVLIPLLSELFTSITHLIKNSAYEHEQEYRLMHIGSIEDASDGSMDQGIYISTEPILFNNPKAPEIIFFGPKVKNEIFLRAKHFFEYERLSVKIKESEIQYR